MTSNTSNAPDLNLRVRKLERRLRGTQGVLGITVGIGAMALLGAAAQPERDVSDEIRTRRLAVVDDQGVTRILIAQDSDDGQRRSRAAGITLFGKDGAERGGFSTFDDDSVVLGLDAPVGVGSAMRDRVGIMVMPSGAAHVMLIDNHTRGAVRLFSNGEGAGGIHTFDWHTDEGYVDVKTLDFHGEKVERVDLGG